MSAKEKLLEALGKVTGTGKFHSVGRGKFFLPGLVVEGFGEVAFPLHPVMAEALKAHAEAAPYGKGEKTILDESVRKCWQIDASRFQLESEEWGTFLKTTTQAVATELGVVGEVVAEPYKLLLYEEGGHFLPHRDSEKVEKMFGTLIIALPSPHQGGELLVRHDGQEVKVDFGEKKHQNTFRYAAFFADCEHEVRPVESGFRCCLVYNLVLKKGDPTLLNLPLTEQAETLLPAMKGLKKSMGEGLMTVLLEHQYTEANFSLKNLKNNDQARARSLMAAAREVGFSARLGLVTFHQMGSLDEEYEGNYYGRGGRCGGNEDATMGEVYEEDLSIDRWRSALDKPEKLGCWTIEAGCLLSENELGSDDPVEQEAEGFTGNAGCTMDYWYRHAAVVLWRTEVEESLMVRYNLDGATERLLTLSKQKGGEKFEKLASAIFAEYAKNAEARSLYRGNEDIQNVLRALANRKEGVLLNQFLKLIPSSVFKGCDRDLWDVLLKVFPAQSFVEVASAMPVVHRERCRDSLFQFLEALLVGKDDSGPVRELALALIDCEQPSLSRLDELAGWGLASRKKKNDCFEHQVILGASFALSDQKQRRKATAFLAGDLSLEHLRVFLGPALLKKNLAPHFAKENSLCPKFLQQAIKQLQEEVGSSLAPYPDWKRPCPNLVNANAKHLLELESFMLDPVRESHDFKYSQHIRSSFANAISKHELDLDCETVKKGTPHTLRCRKNSKSYERLLKVRAQDGALLKKLEKLAG